MKTIINKTSFLFLFLSLLFLWGCNTAPPINQAPTITSTAIISVMVSESYTYDVEATDPDGDVLTYSLITKPSDMTINSSTGLITWTPSEEENYDVTVQVSDGEFADTQSFTLTVTVTTTSLSLPTGVSASDSAYTDAVQITWNAVLGASHYQVYRANAFLGTKIAISGWQTETSYYNTSITNGEIYYYWVKAATGSSGGNATGFSNSDTGYAIFIDISTK